jgi:hypothetical protein
MGFTTTSHLLDLRSFIRDLLNRGGKEAQLGQAIQSVLKQPEFADQLDKHWVSATDVAQLLDDVKEEKEEGGDKEEKSKLQKAREEQSEKAMSDIADNYINSLFEVPKKFDPDTFIKSLKFYTKDEFAQVLDKKTLSIPSYSKIDEELAVSETNMTMTERGVFCEKLAEDLTNVEVTLKQELYQIAYLVGRIAVLISTTVFKSRSDPDYIVFCQTKLKRNSGTIERYIAFYKFLKEYPKMRRVKSVAFSHLSAKKFKMLREHLTENKALTMEFKEDLDP